MASAALPAAATARDRQHFRDLDGLRGVLALAVVLLHFGFNSFTQRALGWQGFRFELAVDVFFLLSGYVLTYATRSGVRAGQFAVRRFLRLAPVFYVTTLVTMLAVPSGWHPAELAMAVPMTGKDPANFPAWSVCWEFYLPVLAVLVPVRVPDRWVKPLLLIALLALGLADVGVAGGEQLYLARAACGLAAGHLLYRSELTLKLPLLPLFAALGLIMALAAYLQFAAILVPFVACLCILAGRNGGSVFATAPAQALGYLSYTLYLVHIPVLRVMQLWFGTAIDANPLIRPSNLWHRGTPNRSELPRPMAAFVWTPPAYLAGYDAETELARPLTFSGNKFYGRFARLKEVLAVKLPWLDDGIRLGRSWHESIRRLD